MWCLLVACFFFANHETCLTVLEENELNNRPIKYIYIYIYIYLGTGAQMLNSYLYHAQLIFDLCLFLPRQLDMSIRRTVTTATVTTCLLESMGEPQCAISQVSLNSPTCGAYSCRGDSPPVACFSVRVSRLLITPSHYWVQYGIHQSYTRLLDFWYKYVG